jgi:membrane-bound lytic murein transglycosylase D
MNLRRLTYILSLLTIPAVSARSQEIVSDTISDFLPDTTAVCTDSLTVEFPESMEFDVDSLMNLWLSKQYLSYDEDCIEGSVNPKFSDTVYAERLSSLPTIVEMPYNYVTRSSIDAYMGRNRKVISYALGMMPIYEDKFVEALIKYDVPIELKYLPIVESALKPKAYSRMGAAGMWQFIYSTGNKYGLQVNSLVDDRYDIAKASDAAARHLRDLYDMFGDWSLAISAYNCGPGNVTKAITRSGGKRDFWDIYPYLPRETRGYLPAFIAVNYAMSFYKEHGICPMTSARPAQTDTLHIERNLHIGQLIHYSGISQDEFKALNPQYLTEVIPGAYRTCVVTLPQQYIKPIVEAGDSLYEYDKEKYFSKAKLAYIDDDMKNRVTYVTHKIKEGETLGHIAMKYHTSVKNIKNWNNLKSDNIRAGKTLRIYNR